MSACSPDSRVRFEIVCSATDICDPEPRLKAKLLVTHHDVSDTGECVERIDEVAVKCGELVEIRLLGPPCPGKRPKSPRSSLRVGSDGIKVVMGEAVVLEVTATDDCGNVASADYDPASEPSPTWDEVLEDGTCCPAIGRPKAGRCEPGFCELDDAGIGRGRTRGGSRFGRPPR